MLPSVLQLLGFGASGISVVDTGAQGPMPFPYGMLGASGTSPPPPPPPPPATPTDPAGASYARFYLGKRKKRRRPDLLQPDERAQLRAVLQSAYDEALGRPAAPEAQAIIAAANYVSGDPSGDRLAVPDWDAILRSVSAIDAILRSYLKARDEEEEEDLILLLH